jgi:hypothetical protein
MTIAYWHGHSTPSTSELELIETDVEVPGWLIMTSYIPCIPIREGYPSTLPKLSLTERLYGVTKRMQTRLFVLVLSSRKISAASILRGDENTAQIEYPGR